MTRREKFTAAVCALMALNGLVLMTVASIRQTPYVFAWGVVGYAGALWLITLDHFGGGA